MGKKYKCMMVMIMIMLAAISILVFATHGRAGNKPMEWRFSTYLSEKREEMTDVKNWAERIQKRSQGKLSITVYPSGALGFKENETLRVLKNCFVESALAFDGYLQRDEPALGTLIVQGVFFEPDDYKKVVEPLREMKKKIYSRWETVWVGMQQSFGKWIYIFSKEPIKSLQDMKGKKIRVWSKDQVEIFSKLGVAAQIIPQAEMYMALKTGVVDGALYPPTAAKSLSLYEVIKYGSRLYPYSTSFSNYLVSKCAWSALPDELRPMLLEAGDWLFEETTRKYGVQEKYDTVIDFLKDKGMVFLEPFPEKDRRLIRETAWVVWKDMAKVAGEMPLKNFEVLRDALSK